MIFKVLAMEKKQPFVMLSLNLLYLKEEKRLKIKDFSKLIDVSMSKMTSYLTGRTYPKYETLITISNTFNLTCDELLKEDLSKKYNSLNDKETTLKEVSEDDLVREDAENYATESNSFKNSLLQLLKKDVDVKKALEVKFTEFKLDQGLNLLKNAIEKIKE